MKHLFIKAMACMAMICFSLSGAAQQNPRSAIDRILHDYPEATLQDIYKSFFQDRFGPGHLIADTVSARRYLQQELKEMETPATAYYEPAGSGENYYRVSLEVIRQGIVNEDEFFSIFLESAGKVALPPVEVWTQEWKEILKEVPVDIEGYQADKEMIDAALSEGNYAMHHSRRYNKAYHPHYRLIDKEAFEKRLLPLLQKQ